MKTALKLISTILVLVLIVNMLPMQIFAQMMAQEKDPTLQNQQITDLSTKVEQANPDGTITILGEIPEGRTEYSKEFLLSNGLHMATLYAEPVHYEKDGVWEEIDNTLKAVKDGTYQNTAGVWNVSFPGQFGNNQSVTIEKGGYTLSFGMPQKLTDSGTAVMSAQADTFAVSVASTATAEVTAKLDVSSAKAEAQYPETVLEGLASRMVYQNIHSNVDVIYDLQSNKVKESVVLEHYDSSLQGFQYILNVGTMVPVLQADGGILLYAPDGETVVMAMPAPYLVDDGMELSTDIRVSLTGKGEQYVLTYQLPKSWLAEADRQWPVILDPVVQADLETTNIRDAVVASTYTFNHLAGFLDVGYEPVPGIKRTFVKYTNLPALTSSDVIVAATMTMRQMYGRSSAMPVEVHKVTGTWESETIHWSNMPGYDETIEDFVMCQSVRDYTWDVTDIVQEWYQEGVNTGMMFKAPDSVENKGEENFRQFYSSDYGQIYKPTLNILFRNNNGLESYWNYTSSSAGRAGTVHVNDYTGNLVLTRSLMGFSGNRMPVSVTLTYNANDAAISEFGLGKGWRSNFNQRVYRWSENSYYYIWEDEDGTQHYFAYDSYGTYKDEDGLELTLTTTGSGTQKYAITDKTGNIRYFDSYGRLRSIVNNQATKSSITVTYKTFSSDSLLINTITDGAGRVYQLFYSNGLATNIVFKGKGTDTIAETKFTFDSSNRLTGITDMDGRTTNYTYDTDHILTSVTDIDGYKLEYGYTAAAGLYAPRRVNRIREYHNGVAGGHMTIAYGNNQTVFTDMVNETTLITQFNNWGNTVSMQDDEGRAQYAQFARNDSDDTTGKGNQLTLSSKMQNTVVNLLPDSSFENGTIWTHSDVVTAGIASIGYLGNKSLMSDGAYLTSPGITAKAGKTYTFSGYVKSEAGAAIEVGIAAGNHGESIVDIIASDWTRFEVSYTNASNADETIYAAFYSDSGISYIDCVQMEEMPTASRYNLVQNGDFATTSGWTGTALAETDTVSPAPAATIMLSQNAYKITGDYESTKTVSQDIPVSGGEGDSFVFGGWAYGNSASLAKYEENHLKDFALKCTLSYTDGTTKEESVQFNPDVTNWQFISAAIAAEKDYNKLTVTAVYSNNANTVYFDGIQVFQEEFGVSYTYDDEGNVKSVIDLQKQKTEYKYEDNKLTQIIRDEKVKMTYAYHENSYNVKSATTEEGLKYEFEYDDYGNNTMVSITQNGLTISSSAAYTDNGNQLESATDALGNTTTYSYNIHTGVLEWVQLPEDTNATRTEYTYDEMYRTATIAADTETGLNLSAEYTYDDDLLTAIETPSTTYTFEYGNFSLRSKVKISNRNLASYTYENGTNRLIKLDYGNQDSVQYTYDDMGRLTKETYEDNQTVSYAYDNSGNLATVTDSETGIVTTYYYDLLNRLSGYREKSATLDHSVRYEYDEDNNLASMTETIGDVTKVHSYSYDDDNRIISETADGVTVTYTYDDFGRLEKREVKNGDTVIQSSTPTYAPGKEDNSTTSQVSSYNGYTYTYDGNGNILTISDGTNTVSYEYDSQNQLVRENNQAQGYTYIWFYDNAGNIQSRGEYNYSTGSLDYLQYIASYDYHDSTWGDLLTAYDGNTITYDEIGNPVSDGTWTYTWKHGRQLTSMTNGSTTWNYTYNADGLRTKRTDGLTRYTYIYNGDKLVRLIVEAQENFDFYFTYDASGTPLTVTGNGYTYYYVTNLQGDVIGIKDGSGQQVVTYAYDAWGNLLHRTNTQLADYNPLRYRGYVYDIETGLYYLQSRYYNPEWGRFINADVFASTGQGLLGDNMFAYCGNNPVIYVDPTGEAGILTVILMGLMTLAIAYFFTSSDANATQSQYNKQLAEAKKKYNNTTVSINDNLNSSQALVKVYINPNNPARDGGPNIHIVNSAYITSRAEREAILDVIIDSPEFDASVFKRGKTKWMREWTGHNALYAVASGKTKERLKHVDLNEKENDLLWSVFEFA